VSEHAVPAEKSNGEVTGVAGHFEIVYLLEKVVGGLLGLVALNFLVVLVTGGYRINLGLLRIAAHHLEGPLLLFLIAAMATVWLRAQRQGIPAAKRWRSPLLLFLSVAFIYSLNGRAHTAGDTIPASYLPLSL
jgi:hypothetical protein